MKNREAVQSEAHYAALVALRAETAHGEITVYLVNHFSFAQHLDFHVIKERMVGCPAEKLFRHVDLHRLPVDGLAHSDSFALKRHLNLVQIVLGRVGEIHIHAHRCLVEIGCGDEILDVIFRHIFKPNRLPNARHGSVENSSWLCNLLSMRDVTVIGRVPNADNEVVLFPLQCLCDVESKRCVTACV